jgi:hypothetical protein
MTLPVDSKSSNSKEGKDEGDRNNVQMITFCAPTFVQDFELSLSKSMTYMHLQHVMSQNAPFSELRLPTRNRIGEGGAINNGKDQI